MSKAIKCGDAVMVKRNVATALAGQKGKVVARHRGQVCRVDFGHTTASLFSNELVLIVCADD
jgi:hypothetical protein